MKRIPTHDLDAYFAPAEVAAIRAALNIGMRAVVARRGGRITTFLADPADLPADLDPDEFQVFNIGVPNENR